MKHNFIKYSSRSVDKKSAFLSTFTYSRKYMGGGAQKNRIFFKKEDLFTFRT